LAHAAGLRADLAGVVLALVATLGCAAVPRLSVRFARAQTRLRDSDRDDGTLAKPVPTPRTAESEQTDTVIPPAAEGVWARMQSHTLTRSALYTGLALSAGLGASVVLTSLRPVQWSGLAFAWGCATALGLHTRRPVTVAERAGLSIPAVALMLSSCVLALNGSHTIPIAAFGVVLVMTLVFAVIGASARPGRLPERLNTLLAYLDYLTTAALIPLALWVLGAYGRWGFT
jgi:hypothetical protein